MQNFFSRMQFFFLSLFVFLIPLQTVYIFRQGPIGQSGLAKEGIWQFGTLALYAIDVLFFLILILAVLRIVLLLRVQEGKEKFFTEVLAQRKDPVFLCLLFLVCIAFFSIFWASDKMLALQMAFWLFEGVMIFFLLSRISQGRRMALAWMFVIGAGVQSVFGIIQFFMQEIFAVSWLGISHHASWIPGDAVVENTERRWLRAYGSFPHPNILAAYVVAGYFFCVTLVMKCEKKIHTWLATLAGIVILFGLILTFSREAWIGLAGGLVVMALMPFLSALSARMAKRRMIRESGAVSSREEWSEIKGSTYDMQPCRFPAEPDRTGLCGAALPDLLPYFMQSVGMTIFKRSVIAIKTFHISPLFFFFLASSVTILFSGMLFSEPLSVRFGIGGWNRLEVKSVQERMGSVKEFLSLGPALIRGVGMGQYTNTLYQNDVNKNTVRQTYAYQPVHNVFFLVLAELGIVGLIAFVGFLFSLGLHIVREYKKISIAILFSFIVIGFFDHFFWTIHGGILLWWVCLAGLDRYSNV